MEAPEAELLIQKLAVAIAGILKKPVPFEHELWTTKEIGAYLMVAPNKVVERYASIPDFPRRIEIPTAEGRISQPRWKAIDVVRWVEAYAE